MAFTQAEQPFSYRLEGFEGPLDLLLTLLSKNKLNIYDIQISVLCDQYLAQIRAMQHEDMDIASEFLEMASRLVYLKTVSLLPKTEEAEALRDELAGQLIEYELCRKMAQKLGAMADGFDCFVHPPEKLEVDKRYQLVHGSGLIYDAYLSAVGRGQRKVPTSTKVFTQIVAKKVVSVSSKIVFVIRTLWSGKAKKLTQIFRAAHNRSELVATFLAVLELCKSNRVKIEGAGNEMTVKLSKEHKKRED